MASADTRLSVELAVHEHVAIARAIAAAFTDSRLRHHSNLPTASHNTVFSRDPKTCGILKNAGKR